MKEKFSIFKSDNIIKLSFISSLILIVLQVLLMVLFSSGFPPLIPLLNSQPWGVERLYPSYYIYALPVVLIIILLINNVLSAAFYRKNTLIARILSFNALLFIFLGILAYIQIVFLVY